MRSRNRLALWVGLAVLTACGTEIASEPGTTAPEPGVADLPPTSATTSATATAPTTVPHTPPVTTPEAVPPPPSDPQPPPTPSTEPPADPLDAAPASALDWSDVGPGWLALSFPDRLQSTPTAIDERGLYLRAPDGRLYAIAALPDDAEVMAVSASGRRALLKGPYDEGLPIGILDLETTDDRPVIPSSLDLESVKFTADGDGLWVYDLIPASESEYLQTVLVSRIGLGDTSWVTVFEESYDLALGNEYYSWWVNNRSGATELADGRLAISTPTGIAVGPPGGPFELLDTPDTSCSVAGVWSDDQLLVRCRIDDDTTADWCDATGLWLTPVDGRPSAVLAEPSVGACDSRYRYAVPFEGGLAVQAMFGDGECTQEVLFVTGDGTTHWEPPLDEPCDEHIVTTIDGALLLVSRIPAWGIRSHFVVSAGTSTPVEIPEARVIPI